MLLAFRDDGGGAMKDRKPVVMVAECDRELIWLYTRWLNEAGCHVRVARDGAWLLAQAVPDPPDLILLDLRIPEVDGLEVCRQLKSSDEVNNVPLVAMAEFMDNGMRILAKQAGANAVLTKPFSRIELVTLIYQILDWDRMDELDEEIHSLERKVWEKLAS
jgi:two-component system phosphate regulon response regulator PhoB